ncbi:Uncharacterized protein PECH_003519 [Penicillium ucsense]|uniref:Uncharacterized protein n=1 Tax=Penicillium ucsense TaxID=2839758 RepID=A0A8J8WJ37_9EURO|nr:Uncharacterized protein PECM_007408 [Penicillium ucsense]KAF7737599.1 Uncharacterized protein PECH_003519 [Penicillium ucsense]
MYGLKQLSVLSFMLLAVTAKEAAQKTTVGIETEEGSFGKTVTLDDCEEIDEEDVFTISVRKHCRVFTGSSCTGRNSLLPPGDHTNKEPVPIISIYCHSKRPF